MSCNDKPKAPSGPDRTVAALLVRSRSFTSHYSSATNTAGVASKAICPCQPFSCPLIHQEPAGSSFLFVFLFPLFLPSIVSFRSSIHPLYSLLFSLPLICLDEFLVSGLFLVDYSALLDELSITSVVLSS